MGNHDTVRLCPCGVVPGGRPGRINSRIRDDALHQKEIGTAQQQLFRSYDLLKTRASAMTAGGDSPLPEQQPAGGMEYNDYGDTEQCGHGVFSNDTGRVRTAEELRTAN